MGHVGASSFGKERLLYLALLFIVRKSDLAVTVLIDILLAWLVCEVVQSAAITDWQLVKFK